MDAYRTHVLKDGNMATVYESPNGTLHKVEFFSKTTGQRVTLDAGSLVDLWEIVEPMVRDVD
jgi:hypothetical protein